jgi:hypothetical protein
MTKTKLLSLMWTALAALPGVMRAQPNGPPTPPPPARPLMECGAHGGVEILCGTRSPEDLELTPDGKYLIVPQFVNVRPGASTPPGEGLTLFDLAAKSYSKMPVSAEPKMIGEILLVLVPSVTLWCLMASRS